MPDFPFGRIAYHQLIEEVIPFVLQLTLRYLCMAAAAAAIHDLRGVEAVPTGAGLFDHTGEIAIECGHRILPSLEPLKLRMVTVASRLALKHCPGE